MVQTRRSILRAALAASFGAAAVALAVPAAMAQDTVKIGMIQPMTGPFASTGIEAVAGAKQYMADHGDTVAGKKIELVVKDDAGSANDTRRIAQELVVNDHANVLMGFGLTPLAFAAAPIATQAKVPMVVTAAATSSVVEKSPFIVRTSFATPTAAATMGKWAADNGIKTAVTLVSDYAPGKDAQDWFAKAFTDGGGKVAEQLTVPLQNPDFAPFLQRVADAKPDALFVFVPSGVGAPFMKQFRERGLADQGIKLIGTGDVVDDQILNNMGDAALGLISAHHYTAAHPSEMNKAFVAAFKTANGGMRPNFMAVGAYDGMALVYQALEKTGGDTDGTKLVDAMKGMKWESPRGPIMIDPDTREIVQNIYINKVERQDDGELYNVEQDTVENVKDPAKAK
ncbi:ABC transporter substrate-binding protein [Mangrovibrevibacter kandeliae]|uniref:ABC transporter substrate-binding protein n=1 Tax=Mangrovibrevibacter kandeliae TaxID=2968473 RepID=UPI0021199C2F|nr:MULTISPECIES: ABC transporter substrate-binding protein [unclassified Aurantimonas]MCQ8781537.1 ABC transporter substrate-binding protein [Aurantimonas sp. CSK15Z-1]MCW4114313.1 ABC transporter substrate-binding protein [Aurantimonas sp. MSK8Z-1]